MKYLLFDHAGVLNQTLNSLGQINESIVNKLNTLVNDYEYQILFHSSNSLAGQLGLLEKLKSACAENNITFPPIVGMAVRDLLNYPNVSSDHPEISTYKEGLKIAAFGIKKEGKACIREALCVMLDIPEADRKQSIVFDDDIAYILQAQKEGYQVKYVGEGVSFEDALDQVLAQNG